MIVDFHHHFTPRELIREDPGDRLILTYDENGAPSYTTHKLLFDMDAHVAMMDAAGVDCAVLSCAAGMSAETARSRVVNDAAKKAERDFPNRFVGFAHANPLGGPDAMKELARCADELGFPGVVITSEQDGLYLDAPEFEPFWAECARRGGRCLWCPRTPCPDRIARAKSSTRGRPTGATSAPSIRDGDRRRPR